MKPITLFKKIVYFLVSWSFWKASGPEKLSQDLNFFLFHDLKVKINIFSDHDYKPEIKYKEEIKGYTIARRGAIALVDQRNFTYIRNGKSQYGTGRVWWLCGFARDLALRAKGENCKARLVTLQNKIIKMSREHNHPPPEECFKYTGFTRPWFWIYKFLLSEI